MITKGQTYKDLTATQIKDDAIRMLAERNVYAWRQHNHATKGRQNNVTHGIPDLPGYNTVTGIATYTEIKKLGDTLKPAQIEFMINAGKSNCVCLVATQRKDRTVLVDFLDYYSGYKVK